MSKAFLKLFLASPGAMPLFVLAEVPQKNHVEVRQAFEACRETLGFAKPEPGQRPVAPTEEQKVQMDDCLAKKGIKLSDICGRHSKFQSPTESSTAQPLGGALIPTCRWDNLR